MNDIILIDTLGNKTAAKVSDSELSKFREIGIKFEFVAKVEKPTVLKEKEQKD